jgi:hypothetical protein
LDFQPVLDTLHSLRESVVPGILIRGASPLNFASAVLSDSLGNTLTATTTSGTVAVSEPAAILLFATGLVVLGVSTRRRWVIAYQIAA